MNRKKLYYVPGLISIICLPALLFLLGLDDPVQQSALRLYLPKEKIIRSDSEFTKGNVSRAIQERKVIDVAYGINMFIAMKNGTHICVIKELHLFKKEIE